MKDWNDSPTVKRWIIIGTAFVLSLFLLAVCFAKSPANAATPTAPAPVSFSDQASLDTIATTDRLLHTTGHNRRGPCWSWDHAFPVTDVLGTAYSFGVRVLWCANPKRTKVTDLATFNCYDAGGYYDYDGCHKSRGSLGYASLGLSTSYKYHHPLGLGVVLTASPSIVFSVYPNGVVAGTVYFDN